MSRSFWELDCQGQNCRGRVCEMGLVVWKKDERGK